MTRYLPRAARRLYCRGVSLLSAVFLIVVLAGLSAAVVGVFTAQQQSSVLDILGVHADQAAKSGLEWGLHRQLRQTAPAVTCFTPNPATFALPANTAMAGFTVTVSCTAGANVDGATTNRWSITSVACNKPAASGCPNASPDPDYIERRVQAQLN